jgi:deoxyribose-phosphate aldolase
MNYREMLLEYGSAEMVGTAETAASVGSAGTAAEVAAERAASAAETAAERVEIAAEVARIRALAPRNHTRDVWTLCLSAVDLTSLSATDTDASIAELAGRVARFGIAFPHLPHPASLCVYPVFVDVAGLALGSSPVAITSVAGGFPSSQTFIEVKMLEAAMAVESGADEIDVVISVGEMLSGEYDRMASSLQLLRDEVGDETVLKVIVEAAALGTPRLVRDASLLAMMAGADFIKTSTGKFEAGTPTATLAMAGTPAAAISTPEAAVVMCRAIRDFHEKTGRQVGFKVAGGVRTAEDAALYYTIVEEILGADWLTPQLFRIGATSLANNLLTAIEGKEINYF